MPLWIPCPVETGLHRRQRVARTGEMCAADATTDLVGRINSALGRRQRQIAGCATSYANPSGAAAAARYYGACRTSSTVETVIARYVIAPRATAQQTDPVATCRLYTKADADGGWTGAPTIYQALTADTWTPDMVSVVEQSLTALTSGGYVAGQDLTYKIDLAYGFRLLAFSLAEQPRSALPAGVGVIGAYHDPGLPVRYDPAAAVWTALATLHEEHGGSGAWWLGPNASAGFTGADYVNVIDGATGTGYARPGIRIAWPSLAKLGGAATHITVWALLQGTADAVKWMLKSTTSGGADTDIAGGESAGAGLQRVRDKAIDFAPHSDVRTYQFLARPTDPADTAYCWSWGFHLEG